MRDATLTLAVVCLLASTAAADELFVPSAEYPTIQAAVDAAVDGDEVVLRDGVFRGDGNLDVAMPPKVLTIRAQSLGQAVIWGEASTFGSGPRALEYTAPASSGSVIQGIVFRECNIDGSGGAVFIESCSISILDCVFVDNEASFGGGAVWLRDGDGHFERCEFNSNSA